MMEILEIIFRKFLIPFPWSGENNKKSKNEQRASTWGHDQHGE
jgi:hypothetical protein